MVGSIRCECCGQAVAALDANSIIVGAKLTPLETRIFQALVFAKGNWISAERLASAVYAHDPDGGPLTADNTIRVKILLLRGKLRTFQLKIDSSSCGYRVVSDRSGPGSLGWRLEGSTNQADKLSHSFSAAASDSVRTE